MSKKESTLTNMILSLVLIAALAAAALAGVYLLTKDSIDNVQKEKKQSALNAVLPGFDGQIFPVPTTVPGDKEPVTVNVAVNKDNTLFGAAVETYTNKAFGGTFTLMVGFDADGNILGTEVIKAAETPGLGDKINKNKSNFAEQFVSMNPAASDFDLKVKKDGGEVDAITAATISSRAYCDAVNRAAKCYHGVKEIALPKFMPSIKINTTNASEEPASEEKGADNE